MKPVDSGAAKERYSSAKTLVKSATPTKQFDVLLSQVVTSCPVDVMPGATDISTLAMPQQVQTPLLDITIADLISLYFSAFAHKSIPSLLSLQLLLQDVQPLRGEVRQVAGVRHLGPAHH